MLQTQDNIYDFVIAGGGTMGLSTALHISLEYPQAKVALLQQFHIGNQNGASHSQTRCLRSTYDHQFYRDLTILCKKQYWAQVQDLLQEKIVYDNPYIAFVEEGAKSYENYKRIASTSNNIKQISSQQAQKQFPYIPKIKTCKTAYYQEGAAVIMSARYIRGLKKYIKQKTSIQIHENIQVLSYQNSKNEVLLKLRNKDSPFTIKSKKVALCCGKWINTLVPSVSTLLNHVKQVVTYWKMKHSQQYKIGKFPIFVHLQNQQNSYDFNYVVPDGGINGDVKYLIFIHDDKYWDQNYKQEDQFIKQVLQYMKKKMQYHYGQEAVQITRVQTCWYSFTKKLDFIIDWTDQNKNVLIVSPCSGHGFKFSPVIGKIVIDLLAKNKSIEIFEKHRHIISLQYQKSISKQQHNKK